jgi:trans-aconitate methyltransferase
MDDATPSAHDRDAKVFADDWHAQPPPIDLHAVVSQFFVPGPTADIGCGSGRDVAWLNARGYPTIGFDASSKLAACHQAS